MGRQIVLDTETTGLSAEGGDRIIEIGCVELINRKFTGNNLHFYLNPDRDSHEDALKVHASAMSSFGTSRGLVMWSRRCWTT